MLDFVSGGMPWHIVFSIVTMSSVVFFFLGRRTVGADYQVAVTPFCRSDSTNWLGYKKVRYEIGYRQQLLVKGLPCLDATEVVLESSKIKEMTREDLVQIAQDAVKAVLVLQGKGAPIVLKDVLMETIRNNKAVLSPERS
ncbi:MAG TPA: hypothetical protein VJ550_14265 [Geomonas sp.]|nr:hypothetical protein [Geomonas sp.]